MLDGVRLSELIKIEKEMETVMPTYEYLCESCGHRFEAFQSMKDDPIEECPLCGAKVRRLIGGGNGLIFKGTGFYITDYKNKNSTGNKHASAKQYKKNGDDKKKNSTEKSST